MNRVRLYIGFVTGDPYSCFHCMLPPGKQANLTWTELLKALDPTHSDKCLEEKHQNEKEEALTDEHGGEA